MLGVIRRKSASGAKVYKKSLSKLKPTVSTPRACAAAPEEIPYYTRGVGNARAFSAMAGRTMSPIPKRSVTNLHMVNVYATLLDGDFFAAVVPDLGELVFYSTLGAFLKKPGDRVEVDELIAVVKVDKGTVGITSPEAGVIQKVELWKGDFVEPGTRVAIISRSENCRRNHLPSPAAADSRTSGEEGIQHGRVEIDGSVPIAGRRGIIFQRQRQRKMNGDLWSTESWQPSGVKEGARGFKLSVSDAERRQCTRRRR
ncbi:dihydrolipoyllysine-residue succinyltransferase component of 2-oxoglutarate dehydrogenase complex [Striga asiatica]|uniref:Dihydrolipoyllysine-residue succinyltransferase component of 2-oxoglutarate dehydrogenase complex n=1 Tax=Striga asiatica TaxID=4170 RepID=A0A5A7P997_STRAF|nr:dihydrolipoyllysine-residue succinyltransferase component of 2-oxoglutarate dehydrogenase complex [Striga asiatica]